MVTVVACVDFNTVFMKTHVKLKEVHPKNENSVIFC